MDLESRGIVLSMLRKKKPLISFAVTVKLICSFVFAYAKCWFTHDAAQFFMQFYKGYNVGWFSGQFFPIFEIKHFCLVVAMNYLVHNVENIHNLC